MQPEKLYSDPEICPKTPTPADMTKRWFINVRYFDVEAGKWRQFPIKKGINKIKKFKERLLEAKALLAAVKDALAKGWNPITGEFPAVDPLKDLQQLDNMTFIQAVKFGLEKCSTSPRTYSNYRNSSNRIMKAARRVSLRGDEKEYDFTALKISDVKKKHIKVLLDHCKKTYRWSNKAYNKHMGYFRAILGRLEEYEVLNYNPASKIKELPVSETKKFVPYTEAEKKQIREHLFLNHYGFFVYLMVEYDTGMRPNEILALQMKDVDLIRRTITIVPELSRDNSKTKNIRYVPITNSLLLLLREWLKETPPAGWYIFGSPYESGRGNSGSAKHGRGSMHPDYFKPSGTRIKRDTVTRLWKKLIIDDLGIKKYLYAGKHTGADDKILAGIDLEALKEMYGHTSKYMTMEYVTKLKEIHRKQIIELSPDF